MPLAMCADGLDLIFQLGDPPPDFSPVDFELRFTRPAQPHAGGTTTSCSTAHLARKVAPLAGEPGKPVLVLRQLHLQSAFSRPRMLREDIQDERRPIDDLNVFSECLFEFALVAWG
jgi:hypothetical protein